jgi:hypothetical protein
MAIRAGCPTARRHRADATHSRRLTVLAPTPCSNPHQAVPNVAAALALAVTTQTAGFALLYDARNPYSAGHGDWPGWLTVLRHTLDGAHPQLQFRARSWQELIAQLPLDAAALAWASEKHGLD